MSDEKKGDGLESILADLAVDGLGVDVVRNPETGALAMFPRKLTVEEWERRAVAFHEAQRAAHEAEASAEREDDQEGDELSEASHGRFTLIRS